MLYDIWNKEIEKEIYGAYYLYVMKLFRISYHLIL